MLTTSTPIEEISESELLLPLRLAHRRLRREAAAATREGVGAVRLPLPGDRALREGVPARRPITQGVAVPGRLRRKRRQIELLPDRARPLHEFARRQGERRRDVLERG